MNPSLGAAGKTSVNGRSKPGSESLTITHAVALPKSNHRSDAARGHGNPQRDAGFLFRRQPLCGARCGARAGAQIVAEGAAIIDVGGESTRPGALAVDEAVEIARVVPVIEGIAASCDTAISIDTTKPR